MAITDTQIDNAIPEYGDPTPHPTQPNQALMNELLKDVRDEVATALTPDTLQQTVGVSTTTAMSQKAVSDQLLGVGQTWQNMLASRALGTTYTNSTGRTIFVSVVGRSPTAGAAASIGLSVDGRSVDFSQITADPSVVSNAFPNVSAAVPAGSNYVVSTGSHPAELNAWLELR